jgi:excinuclease UvrABC ATPase subunit
MLHVDEDDLFVGSPQSKFFDILFHANKSIVEQTVLECIEKHVSMEQLLESLAQKYNFDLEYELENYKIENQDALYNGTNDFFIATVGDVLTKHE